MRHGNVSYNLCLMFKKICLLRCVLFQEAVSVADVVLWAALYPVLSDASLALGK